MNAIVVEHVEVSELPEAWRAQLHVTGNVRVTVRIEEEPSADVAGYVRKVRAPRFPRG